MIRENLEAVCEQYHYHGKLSVVISIPSGVELAAKTFNPRLGNRGRYLGAWNQWHCGAYE